MTQHLPRWMLATEPRAARLAYVELLAQFPPAELKRLAKTLRLPPARRRVARLPIVLWHCEGRHRWREYRDAMRAVAGGASS